MTVYHLSIDLMLIGRISAASRAAGSVYRSFPSREALIAAVRELPAAGGNGNVQVRLLIDLQVPGLDPAELEASLREMAFDGEVVAYAQHLRTDLLDAARNAGIGRVLTRGQLDRKVPELVA